MAVASHCSSGDGDWAQLWVHTSTFSSPPGFQPAPGHLGMDTY